MRQLTREHQAVSNFKTAIAQLRPVVEDEESIQYTRFFDAFEGSVSSFMLTELYIRQGDRCAALDVFPDLKDFSNEYGTKLNNQGIDTLTIAKEFLVGFRASLPTQTATDADFQTVLNSYFNDAKEMISQVEIKGSDADELGTKFRAVLDNLEIGNSGTNLMDYTITQIQDLIDVRGTSGRGAETNIAIWKLIAAAVLFALGTWVVYKCYYSRWRCSKKEQAIYNSILAIALVLLGACE